MKIITLHLALAMLVSLIGNPVFAQDSLDTYVQEGLNNNLVLKQKNIGLGQAQNALGIARSYFMPNVQLLTDYTSGKGGRSISLPIGDLLNPVYASLNQLTQSDAFPQIENVKQNFFPYNFYDAKIRTSIPLINSDLYINQSIKSKEIQLRDYDVRVYQRQLVFSIKEAYYQYLSAHAAVEIYANALQLVEKNLTVNESLVRNGKSLYATVLRSKAEAEKVKADLLGAQNTMEAAKKYFNFLLNRELEAAIDTNFDVQIPALLPDYNQVSIREEISLLRTAVNINENALRLSQYGRLPKLNAFVDLGSQASNWQFNDQSKYYLVGLQFSLPLFQGFRQQLAIKNGRMEVQRSKWVLDQTIQQLDLSVTLAEQSLKNSVANLEAARLQLAAADEYFKLINKGYVQGVNSLIEFLDARTQLTSAELQYSLKSFDVMTALAKVERETATYPIANN